MRVALWLAFIAARGLSWAPRRSLARPQLRRHAQVVQIDADGKSFPVAGANGKPWAVGTTAYETINTEQWSTYLAATRAGTRLSRVFLPASVNPEYLSYTKWRALQRLLSATVNVFGLQAMIMAVGLRDSRAVTSGKVVGAAAAIDWVLKDALGKVTRLCWAGKMGREFDGDAKRWRFRSSLLYATGNGLQIATFAFPGAFLALATFANCLKQISMLTSTATRSAIYRSFAATEATNNLGDITAKGEAQIAVVDLVGLSVGLGISKAFGLGTALANRRLLLGIYALLSLAEIAAMYREIRCVVFRQLNLDRALAACDAFVAGEKILSPVESARTERILLSAAVRRRDVFRPAADVALHVGTEELRDAVEASGGDEFLVLRAPSSRGGGDTRVVILGRDADDDAVLDGLLARALALRGEAAGDRTPANLRKALGEAGWSTSSFMLPDLPVRAHWKDT